MTTFIKTKFKISDYLTNIDKYRLSAKITVHISYHIKINLETNHYYKLLWPRESFEKSKISDLIWNPNQISKSKKENYSNRSINKEIGHLWSESGLRESTISDLESPSNFQVKQKNY